MSNSSSSSQKPLDKRRLTLCNVEVTVDSMKKQTRRKSLTSEAIASLERAEKFQSELDRRFPSFVKHMTQSHVSGGFWLGLPSHFCKMHLPKEDSPIILIDENLGEFETKYLAPKTGLSGGWRGFSLEHWLVEGDTLVFQLVDPRKFKVYIFRASGTSHATKEFTYPKIKKQFVKKQRRYAGRFKQPVHPEETTELSASSFESSEPSSSSMTSSEYEPEAENKSTNSSTDLKLVAYKDEKCSYKHVLGEENNNSSDVKYNKKSNCGEAGAGASPTQEFEPPLHGTEDVKCIVRPKSNCFQCFRFKEGIRRKTVEAESLTKDNEHLRYLMSCKVCMDRNMSVLLLPCMHICSCNFCGSMLRLCPICNAAKVSSIEVLFS